MKPQQRLYADLPEPVPCPCCASLVRTPTLEMVTDLCGLTSQEEKVLRAVWKGRGIPVSNDRIFNHLYEDDPEGGPSPTKMYSALKVALCHLRKKLRGSGIHIENAGYRRGFRLRIEEVH